MGKTDSEVAKLWEAYQNKGFGERLVSKDLPHMIRPIPVGETVSAEHSVLPYEAIPEVLAKVTRPITVSRCWCRGVKNAGG